MSAQIHRWPVPIDDRDHEIGGGSVVLVAMKRDELCVWTRENTDSPVDKRHVQVFATGQDFPEGLPHLGSVVDGVFVWHVFEVANAWQDWRADP